MVANVVLFTVAGVIAGVTGERHRTDLGGALREGSLCKLHSNLNTSSAYTYSFDSCIDRYTYITVSTRRRLIGPRRDAHTRY